MFHWHHERIWIVNRRDGIGYGVRDVPPLITLATVDEESSATTRLENPSSVPWRDSKINYQTSPIRVVSRIDVLPTIQRTRERTVTPLRNRPDKIAWSKMAVASEDAQPEFKNVQLWILKFFAEPELSPHESRNVKTVCLIWWERSSTSLARHRRLRNQSDISRMTVRAWSRCPTFERSRLRTRPPPPDIRRYCRTISQTHFKS